MPLNSTNACEISSEQWTAAGHSEQKMVNLINRLKIRHTEEAAKGTAGAKKKKRRAYCPFKRLCFHTPLHKH
jgi:hypothetical protein